MSQTSIRLAWDIFLSNASRKQHTLQAWNSESFLVFFLCGAP